ncbi:fatty acid-binding protein-like [Gigantopelta aegis]|uniref:fatty acid-binding protein-like n=1 Tax=Gigantopelta aegis TaxID=1735272 RepID=UPI001B8884AD|nr:fatty acid-binding protein-like [Gigantopelta aegis]
MDAQLGKWKVVKEETTGLDEFLTKLGLPKEAQAAYKDLDYTIETSKDGDSFKSVVNITGRDPLVYTWKLGEAFEYQSLDGTKPMLTVTEEGDTVVESYTLEKFNRQWKCVRKVDGDAMTATTSCEDVSMVQKLKRV